MISNVLQRELARRGVDEHEGARIAALFELSIGALQRISGRAPERAFWVPGRIEVFGKHTDYAGGRSLIATVPRGFAFVGAPRSDGVVRLIAVATNDVREFLSPSHPLTVSPSSLSPSSYPPGDWGRYVA